jgi:hypothetical protein
MISHQSDEATDETSKQNYETDSQLVTERTSVSLHGLDKDLNLIMAKWEAHIVNLDEDLEKNIFEDLLKDAGQRVEELKGDDELKSQLQRVKDNQDTLYEHFAAFNLKFEAFQRAINHQTWLQKLKTQISESRDHFNKIENLNFYMQTFNEHKDVFNGGLKTEAEMILISKQDSDPTKKQIKTLLEELNFDEISDEKVKETVEK